MSKERILVIKLGALGDLVFALGPMQAIRDQHPDAELTCLTRQAYCELLEASRLFDVIWPDPNPRPWQIGRSLAFRKQLREAGFSWVYDLQTSDRSNSYFRLFWPGPYPRWSGIARGASHRHIYPRPNRQHTVDRQRAQLAIAGIEQVPLTDLSAIDGDIGHFNLPEKFVLMVPGSSPHSLDKRWSTAHFRSIAERLIAHGITPVIIGGASEQPLARALLDGLPGGIDLTGQTKIVDIPPLAGKAQHAVGNDTGPIHLIAATGCPLTVLFSRLDALEKNKPGGPQVTVLQNDDLQNVSVDQVWTAMQVSRAV